ncbi:MAG: hypothetical protein V2A62_03250 [Candidatus Woesearchaeota archaeon]
MVQPSLEAMLASIGTATDLNGALTLYDRVDTEEFKLGMVNDYYIPAQTKLHSSIESGLRGIFAGESKTINSDTERHQVKSVITGSLKEYFAIVSPSLLNSMNTIGLSEEEQFEFLLQEYDKGIGGGKVERLNTLGALVNGLMKGKISTSQFQYQLYTNQAQYVNIASNIKTNALVSQIFAPYESYQLAAHLMPIFERAGYEVSDKPGYLRADLRKLLDLRTRIVRPEREDIPYLRRRETA